jgi:predicted TIM-barrel fold metal-dependent hydrolase
VVDAIIDAHHHIWRLSDTPWLQSPQLPRIFGAYEAIRRDYGIADYLADATPSGVVKSVFVQVKWHRARRSTSWRGCSRSPTTMASSIRSRPSPTCRRLLSQTRSTASSPPARRMRSVSSCIGEKRVYRLASRPDVMNDRAWRKGLDEVHRRGLMFKLQVFAGQMPDAVELVRDYGDMTFILLHAGMLDRTEAGWALWRAGIKPLAACPNVMVKLSGLGTFDCACWRWRPVIEETVDLFDPARWMFGSNFPIEKLWTDYVSLVAEVRDSLSHYTAPEQRAVLHDSVARLYKL